MRRQQRGTYPADGNSYLCFFVALCAHLVVAALIAVLPSLTIEQKPVEIVTINLADMVAPPSSGGAASPPPKAEKKPPPEPTKIEATPVKEKPLTPPEPVPPPPKIEPKVVKEKPAPEPPPQVVSLKSQHQVKKVPPEPPKPEVVKPPKKDEKTVRREFDKLREQLTKEQQQRELNKLRKEEQEAKADAAKLMNELAGLKAQESIMTARERGLGSGPTRSGPNRDNAASSGADSALAQQYYARIVGQLKSLWKLPDYKDWPPNLSAKVVVSIDKNGKISDVQFEKRSGDDAFDRLVQKTLGAANPLPSIPPALKKERLEFSCTFTPDLITGR